MMKHQPLPPSLPHKCKHKSSKYEGISSFWTIAIQKQCDQTRKYGLWIILWVEICLKNQSQVNVKFIIYLHYTHFYVNKHLQGPGLLLRLNYFLHKQKPWGLLIKMFRAKSDQQVFSELWSGIVLCWCLPPFFVQSKVFFFLALDYLMLYIAYCW